MDKFFASFGKIVLVLLVGGLLIGGGIYFGEQLGKKSATPSPTPINPQSVQTTQAQSLTATPTQEPSHFVVEAGGIKPFDAYTLSAITGWAISKNHNAGMDQIILAKGEYQLSILQAALGGGGCSFPGEAAQDMSVLLTSPIDIPLQTGLPLRRGTAQSPTTGKMAFTICQKGSSGSYGTLTEYGVINYSTPLNPATDMMVQLDAMVGSLQKQ